MVRLFQAHAHACVDASQAGVARQDRPGHLSDGMVEFDGFVGQLLKQLDDLGIADNPIVVWTSDNGAEVVSWPDGGTTPFRGEKATNWEGGYRVPTVIRWPGMIKPDTVYNDVLLALRPDPYLCRRWG